MDKDAELSGHDLIRKESQRRLSIFEEDSETMNKQENVAESLREQTQIVHNEKTRQPDQIIDFENFDKNKLLFQNEGSIQENPDFKDPSIQFIEHIDQDYERMKSKTPRLQLQIFKDEGNKASDSTINKTLTIYYDKDAENLNNKMLKIVERNENLVSDLKQPKGILKNVEKKAEIKVSKSPKKYKVSNKRRSSKKSRDRSSKSGKEKNKKNPEIAKKQTETKETTEVNLEKIVQNESPVHTSEFSESENETEIGVKAEDSVTIISKYRDSIGQKLKSPKRLLTLYYDDNKNLMSEKSDSPLPSDYLNKLVSLYYDSDTDLARSHSFDKSEDGSSKSLCSKRLIVIQHSNREKPNKVKEYILPQDFQICNFENVSNEDRKSPTRASTSSDDSKKPWEEGKRIVTLYYDQEDDGENFEVGKKKKKKLLSVFCARNGSASTNESMEGIPTRLFIVYHALIGVGKEKTPKSGEGTPKTKSEEEFNRSRSNLQEKIHLKSEDWKNVPVSPPPEQADDNLSPKSHTEREKIRLKSEDWKNVPVSPSPGKAILDENLSPKSQPEREKIRLKSEDWKNVPVSPSPGQAIVDENLSPKTQTGREKIRLKSEDWKNVPVSPSPGQAIVDENSSPKTQTGREKIRLKSEDWKNVPVSPSPGEAIVDDNLSPSEREKIRLKSEDWKNVPVSPSPRAAYDSPKSPKEKKPAEEKIAPSKSELSINKKPSKIELTAEKTELEMPSRSQSPEVKGLLQKMRKKTVELDSEIADLESAEVTSQRRISIRFDDEEKPNIEKPSLSNLKKFRLLTLYLNKADKEMHTISTESASHNKLVSLYYNEIDGDTKQLIIVQHPMSSTGQDQSYSFPLPSEMELKGHNFTGEKNINENIEIIMEKAIQKKPWLSGKKIITIFYDHDMSGEGKTDEPKKKLLSVFCANPSPKEPMKMYIIYHSDIKRSMDGQSSTSFCKIKDIYEDKKTLLQKSNRASFTDKYSLKEEAKNKFVLEKGSIYENIEKHFPDKIEIKNQNSPLRSFLSSSSEEKIIKNYPPKEEDKRQKSPDKLTLEKKTKSKENLFSKMRAKVMPIVANEKSEDEKMYRLYKTTDGVTRIKNFGKELPPATLHPSVQSEDAIVKVFRAPSDVYDSPKFPDVLNSQNSKQKKEDSKMLQAPKKKRSSRVSPRNNFRPSDYCPPDPLQDPCAPQQDYRSPQGYGSPQGYRSPQQGYRSPGYQSPGNPRNQRNMRPDLQECFDQIICEDFCNKYGASQCDDKCCDGPKGVKQTRANRYSPVNPKKPLAPRSPPKPSTYCPPNTVTHYDGPITPRRKACGRNRVPKAFRYTPEGIDRRNNNNDNNNNYNNNMQDCFDYGGYNDDYCDNYAGYSDSDYECDYYNSYDPSCDFSQDQYGFRNDMPSTSRGMPPAMPSAMPCGNPTSASAYVPKMSSGIGKASYGSAKASYGMGKASYATGKASYGMGKASYTTGKASGIGRSPCLPLPNDVAAASNDSCDNERCCDERNCRSFGGKFCNCCQTKGYCPGPRQMDRPMSQNMKMTASEICKQYGNCPQDCSQYSSGIPGPICSNTIRYDLDVPGPISGKNIVCAGRDHSVPQFSSSNANCPPRYTSNAIKCPPKMTNQPKKKQVSAKKKSPVISRSTSSKGTANLKPGLKTKGYGAYDLKLTPTESKYSPIQTSVSVNPDPAYVNNLRNPNIESCCEKIARCRSQLKTPEKTLPPKQPTPAPPTPPEQKPYPEAPFPSPTTPPPPGPRESGQILPHKALFEKQGSSSESPRESPKKSKSDSKSKSPRKSSSPRKKSKSKSDSKSISFSVDSDKGKKYSRSRSRTKSPAKSPAKADSFSDEKNKTDIKEPSTPSVASKEIRVSTSPVKDDENEKPKEPKEKTPDEDTSESSTPSVDKKSPTTKKDEKSIDEETSEEKIVVHIPEGTQICGRQNWDEEVDCSGYIRSFPVSKREFMPDSSDCFTRDPILKDSPMAYGMVETAEKISGDACSPKKRSFSDEMTSLAFPSKTSYPGEPQKFNEDNKKNKNIMALDVPPSSKMTLKVHSGAYKNVVGAGLVRDPNFRPSEGSLRLEDGKKKILSVIYFNDDGTPKAECENPPRELLSLYYDGGVDKDKDPPKTLQVVISPNSPAERRESELEEIIRQFKVCQETKMSTIAVSISQENLKNQENPQKSLFVKNIEDPKTAPSPSPAPTPSPEFSLGKDVLVHIPKDTKLTDKSPKESSKSP